MLRILATLLCLALTSSAHAQEGTFAIRGARVLPVVGPELARGTVLVRDGRIAALGKDVEIPEGVTVLEAEGLVLIPGLVDTRSHLGLAADPAPRGSEGFVGTLAAARRTLDGIRPSDPALRMATAGGVTTAQLMPEGADALGGQTAYVKLRGRSVEEMLIDLGPRRGGFAMGAGEEARELLERAWDHRAAWKEHRERLAAGEPSAAPASDLGLEALVEVLERRRTVHYRAWDARDAQVALDLAEEYGFELVLHPLGELAGRADELARRGHPVSLPPADAPGAGNRAADLGSSAPALLEAAGVRVALHSADPASHSRQLLRAGALAVQGGLGREAALRSLTLEGARILHLEDKLGSIERGKHADLVLLSGDPFSIYTRVLGTWIEGRRVFDRTRPGDLRYATGGHAVHERLPARDRAPTAPQVLLERRAVERPSAPGERFAVEAEWLFTAAGPPISRGVVLVENGRISAVGAQGEIALPAGTPVFRAPAVTPGLIEAHSEAGLPRSFSGPAGFPGATDPSNGRGSARGHADGQRAADSFDPKDRRLAHLLARGVTVVQAVPRTGAPFAGQAGIFRTYGATAEEARVRRVSALVLDLTEGLGRAGTRMEAAARIRAALQEARAWAARAEGEREPSSERTALARGLSGELPVIFVAQRADELSTALRIAREFELRCVLSQAAEGYLVAEEIARAATPVLVGPALLSLAWPGAANACYENAALLREAGIPIALTSGPERPGPGIHPLSHEAAVAAVNGLGVVPALRAVTVDAARLLGIEAERGSLERGKAADLVLWDGDPLETTSRVEVVIGDGRVVHDRLAPR